MLCLILFISSSSYLPKKCLFEVSRLWLWWPLAASFKQHFHFSTNSWADDLSPASDASAELVISFEPPPSPEDALPLRPFVRQYKIMMIYCFKFWWRYTHILTSFIVTRSFPPAFIDCNLVFAFIFPQFAKIILAANARFYVFKVRSVLMISYRCLRHRAPLIVTANASFAQSRPTFQFRQLMAHATRCPRQFSSPFIVDRWAYFSWGRELCIDAMPSGHHHRHIAFDRLLGWGWITLPDWAQMALLHISPLKLANLNMCSF